MIPVNCELNGIILMVRCGSLSQRSIIFVRQTDKKFLSSAGLIQILLIISFIRNITNYYGIDIL